MKKVYLLSLFCCLTIAAMAQTTIQIYPIGGPGTYATGSSDGTTRTDDNITSSTSPTAKDGYAVFDLSVIPAGATIDACTINFNVATYGGGGTPSLWNTYGFVGDLSTVTVPAALFADMTAGTSISTASYGTAPGNQVIPSSALITNFIAANMTNTVSVCFTGGGTRNYTITGESGTATPAGVHQPYLNVTYCSKPTITSTSATPNPICVGANLTLSESVTFTGAGLLGYSWTGPGAYSSLLASPTFATSLTSAGVYSLTVTHVCGAFTATATATTTTVTVNPVPAPITGSSAVCTTNSTPLSDITGGGGTWKSSSVLTASVTTTTGIVSGISTGGVTISYILPVTGCYATFPMTVNAPPGAISGPTAVCENKLITLLEGSISGIWSSSSTTTATVDIGGNVTGVSGGPVTIDYTIAGCPAATYPIIVNPKPGPIFGGPTVCIGVGTPTTLSDTYGGGVWTSTNTSANVFPSGFSAAKVFGSTVGTDTIIYTMPSTGCTDSTVVNVVAGPLPITGTFTICQGQSTPLADGSSPGFWSTQNAMIASVVPGSGLVSGTGAGIVNITYTLGTGCFTTQKMTVRPEPAAITAPTSTICSNDSVVVSDTDPLGRWTSGNTSMATVDTLSGLVKGVSAGSPVITYTFLSTGCYNVFPMTINPAPSDVITASGPTTFCAGGTVTLSVPAGGGGTTYQWFNAGLAIAGATTSNYTTTTTQSLTIQVENIYGCISVSPAQLVIAGLTATVDSNGTSKFCAGRNVILTAKPGSGTVGVLSYQWEKNGVGIAGANANNYLANTTGVYDCIVTVSGGGSGSCSATTSSVNVTAHPIPGVMVTSVKTPAGTKFTATTGFPGYQWFLNTMAIPGAVYNTYTAPINGSYRVMVTDTNGCTGYSPEIVINNVGVAQVNKADVKIYPNPASNMIHVESPVSVHALITSIEGKTLINEANAKDINISGLANGVYIIMLYNESGERLMVEKLIKE